MAIPKSPFQAKSEWYFFRKAAQYSNYAWEAFLALSGPEQSEVVAFYWAETAQNAILAARRT